MRLLAIIYSKIGVKTVVAGLKTGPDLVGQQHQKIWPGVERKNTQQNHHGHAMKPVFLPDFHAGQPRNIKPPVPGCAALWPAL
jgi:hypothetical protein